MSAIDPDQLRSQMRERWERSAVGWERAADDVRRFGMPVATAMIEGARLQPGLRVLELAAGPGDVGLLAAELIRPGGTLIFTDGAEAMVDAARRRAAALGIDNAEFRQMELEWIDLQTASVDRVLCRWGLMFAVDPGASLSEMRRVLAPSGRVALAVWDEAAQNPWATIPTRTLVELGHVEPPDPAAPGMFAQAAPGVLEDLLQSAGFVEVEVERVDVERGATDVDAYIRETVELSSPFSEALSGMDDEQRRAVRSRIGELAQPYARPDGSLRLPGRSLVAAAAA